MRCEKNVVEPGTRQVRI